MTQIAPSITEKIARGESLRILFLNDVGFQYGAGIAMGRQAKAILALGHEVMLLCWQQGREEERNFLAHCRAPERWLGTRELRTPKPLPYEFAETVVDDVVAAAAAGYPDVILVHNIHYACWPLELLPALQRLRCVVVAYMHDLYFATGRCAYAGSCERYLTQCNAECPTATEYPPLPPPKIAPAYDLRRRIFTGAGAIPLAANSGWTRRVAAAAFHERCDVETVHFGLDENLFRPGDKQAARRKLGVPESAVVILAGAVNFDDVRKGGSVLQRVVKALKNKAHFLIFGRNSTTLSGVQAVDLCREPEQMARLYQAADIFLGTALEEAFGQTLLEASACALPIVAFRVGGAPEIAREGQNANLVEAGDIPAMVSALEAFIIDPSRRRRYGEGGRKIVETEFTLMAHAQRWQTYLAKLGSPFRGRDSGSTLPDPSGAEARPPELTYSARPLGTAGALLPSWQKNPGYVTPEHEAIYEQTKELPGWQMEGDSYKLYEMGYFAGDVILEIGMWGGRSAVCELKGALANPERANKPRFYGVDIDPGAIERTTGTLNQFQLLSYANLFHGDLEKFVSQRRIEPTMVFVDGDHRYEGVKKDLQILSGFLRPGIPVLVHDYANPGNETGELGVRKAADEWETAGHARFAGQFGCSGLFVIDSKK